MHTKLNWKRIIFLLLSLTIFPGCSSSKGGAGGPAPDFSLKDTSGNTVSLKDLRGKYVILDFWATWCPPCLMSIPELVSLHGKYKDRDLVVLGISLDDPDKVDTRALNRFREQHRIGYTILRGNDKVVYDYSGRDGMPIPTMFLLDREGRIVEKLVGYIPGRVEKSVKKLLG
ncbi:MAG: TlpA family protein disulfide reductase [Desulfobacteraceae bacterium]|nr:MAG: TlpA family protein disulfide reductase [Desulfobacteraceae bacterium]